MQHCCKVGRLTATYDLQHAARDGDVDGYLRARWLGQDEYTETGLRPLKEWFNKQLLKSVYTDHNRSTLATRVDADYEALSGEEPDISLLGELEADGIDGNQLRSDFLSTSTLYRHLTDCLSESKSNNAAEGDSDWEADKVDYAKEVVERSVRESLQSLENKSMIPEATRSTIKTEVILGCPECATQVRFERALERGYICQDHMASEITGPSDGG
ncbi:rod-determining factor RdfA [Haloarcula laminariae]|uniref:rod-determining factor RdfA n=1 Tax=Haloarcula laminariae TaxID=2961577 RepID=UPI0021C71335|nr:rod-determining factor RdfA [Halomicroarcula laminariae]